MILTLEALRAQEGDCLLLHFGTRDAPRLALIDGGPGQTYEDVLLPRLQEIHRKRGTARLDIDLAMVSHIDNDHITGIKKLFRRLQTEIEDDIPDRPFRVRRLWHNTFNDVLDDSIDEYYESFQEHFTASTDGKPDPKLVKALERILAHNDEARDAAEAARDIGGILAGQPDGRQLRDIHAFLFGQGQILALNYPFGGASRPTLIAARGSTTRPVTIDKIAIRVVGPLDEEIEALQAAFDTFLKSKKLAVEAFLAAYADKSVTNLSSIVCLVEAKGKRILLTGDARGDLIVKGLRKAKLLKKEPLFVDVLKVPHHGSRRNVESDFFDDVVADWYVLSGNGVHGNPARETIEMILAARGPKATFNLAITHSVAEIDKARRVEFAKRKRTWKADRDSIAALLKEKKQAGFKFRVTDGDPIRIKLGDEAIA